MWASVVCYGASTRPSNNTWSKSKITILRKTPWKLSVTRKANQRKRLKQVDAVIEAVRASGVKCSALVGGGLWRSTIIWLILLRIKLCYSPKKAKCQPRTNTPFFHLGTKDTGKAFIKSQNSPGCVEHSLYAIRNTSESLNYVTAYFTHKHKGFLNYSYSSVTLCRRILIKHNKNQKK